MYTLERIGDNSPLGVRLTAPDNKSVKIALPMPSEVLPLPLELKGEAGLLRHSLPSFSNLCRARKKFYTILPIDSLAIDLEFNVFRWWGNWFKETKIENTAEEETVEKTKFWPSKDGITPHWRNWKGVEAPRMAPLRILEISTTNQRWFIVEAPGRVNGLAHTNPCQYELWLGERWTARVVSSKNQSILRKLDEVICDDGA